jgi:poly-gamma-glutamate synthesis protein (capsule biosynthesis protein)
MIIFNSFSFSKTGKEITLIAGGDINLVSKRPDYIKINGLDNGYYFKHIKNVLQRGKIRFCNFEQTVTSKHYKPKPYPGKPYVFMGTDAHLDTVKNAGFNVINIANNHIMDYGEKGLRLTINAMNKRNMLWFGAGINEKDARKALIIRYKGRRIAFLGYIMKFNADFHAGPYKAGCPSYMNHRKNLPHYKRNKIYPGTEFNFKKDIDRIRHKADMFIVSIHFGPEYQIIPSNYQVKTAKAAVDAGASIVLGHHPHVIQKITRYKNAVICYSLGNLVFPSYFMDPYIMLVEFKIDRNMKVSSVIIHPFVVKNKHDFNLCMDDYVMFMPVPAKKRWLKGFKYMLKKRGFNTVYKNNVFYLK